jgi:hypothetical protein
MIGNTDYNMTLQWDTMRYKYMKAHSTHTGYNIETTRLTQYKYILH